MFEGEEVGKVLGGEAVWFCEVWDEKIRERGSVRKGLLSGIKGLFCVWFIIV